MHLSAMTSLEGQIAKAYNTLADDYARLLPDLRAENELDRAMIGSFAKLVRGGTGGLVVELGCGTGRIAAHLDRLGLDVVGFDVSEGMVTKAARSRSRPSFGVGSIGRTPLPAGSVAGVVSWYSIIHTPTSELEGVFAEFARVLRPGGHLLVGFHAGDGSRRFSRPCGRQVDLDAFDHQPDAVAALIVNAGFAIHTEQVRAAEGSRAPIAGKHHRHHAVTERRSIVEESSSVRRSSR